MTSADPVKRAVHVTPEGAIVIDNIGVERVSSDSGIEPVD
jgi:hypothetical protein